MTTSRDNGAIVGVSDHAGWAVLMTVARDGVIVDRRRITLVDADLPSMPHHHEAQTLPLAEAEDLIDRVRICAERHATLALELVVNDTSLPIRGIALRKLQLLPPTTGGRIRDYRARNVADWVMYRKALADAATARGWFVHWFDAKTVFDSACEVLQVKSLDAHFLQARKALGPPWNIDHKLATAAAIAAATRERPTP